MRSEEISKIHGHGMDWGIGSVKNASSEGLYVACVSRLYEIWRPYDEPGGAFQAAFVPTSDK